MLIKERMESGMTVREWCHDRNIKESQYYYWLRILCREEVKNTIQNPQVSPFVELPADICREQFPALAATVIRKGNIIIKITESASAGFFQKVMEALANLQKAMSFSNSFWKTALHSPEVVFRPLTV